MTEYQYDEHGYLLSVTEPNGNTVSYTYDKHGNRSSMTYPDGKTVNYSYPNKKVGVICRDWQIPYWKMLFGDDFPLMEAPKIKG